MTIQRGSQGIILSSIHLIHNRHLFKHEVPNHHTAIDDTIVCAKIHFKIKYDLDNIEKYSSV